ncbi:hypothetical protein HYQ46_004124 [Verticillium longisporum]|nr:hypothetical protein HYQ46_004124 [Verticillium longisporum]
MRLKNALLLSFSARAIAQPVANGVRARADDPKPTWAVVNVDGSNGHGDCDDCDSATVTVTKAPKPTTVTHRVTDTVVRVSSVPVISIVPVEGKPDKPPLDIDKNADNYTVDFDLCIRDDNIELLLQHVSLPNPESTTTTTTTTSSSTVAAAPPIWAPQPELPSSAPVWPPEPAPTTPLPTVWEPTPVPAPSLSAPVIGVPEPSPVSSSIEVSSALPSVNVSQPSVPVWSAPSALPSEFVSSAEPTSWAPTPTTLVTLVSSITEAPVPVSTTHTPDDGLWYSAKYPPHHNGTEGRFWK